MGNRLARIMTRKYRNRPCVWGGVKFASQRERDRYIELKALEQQGKILWFEHQPKPFILTPKNNKFRKMTYQPDFMICYTHGIEYEDTKGFITDVFKVKQKVLWHFFGIYVKVVK